MANELGDLIDGRFPMRPSQVKVPLYPQLLNFDLDMLLAPYEPNQLLQKIATHYNAEQTQIMLGSSATDIFLIFIKYLQNKKKSKTIKIALPAFFCHHFAIAIAQIGAQIFFLDIDDNFGLKEDSVERIISERCDVLIVPHFFGARKNLNSLIDFLSKQNIIVILDEAQSFPIKVPIKRHNKNVATIFSFGKNKPIASAGGGGMCFHDITLIPPVKTSINPKNRLFNNYHIFKEISMEWLKQTCKPFIGKKEFEQKLCVLVEKSANKKLENFNYVSSGDDIISNQVAKKFPHISPLKERLAFQYWKCWEQRQEILKKRNSELNNLLINKNQISTHPIEGIIDFPTIFSILVEARFETSIILSKFGIESTWYYYPLNRISTFKHFWSENTLQTDFIASRILILPFQHHQTDTQFNLLKKGLEAL